MGNLGRTYTRVHSNHYLRTRGCGCTGHPAFPTPSFGAENFLHNPGAMRRGIAGWRLEHRFHEQALARHAAEARLALPALFPIIAVAGIDS